MPAKLIARRKADQNRSVIDPWTAVHFAAGLAAGLTRVPLRWSFTAAVLYEIAEQILERRRWGKEFFHVSGPEVPENVAMDLLVFLAGVQGGERWNATGEPEPAGRSF